MPKRTSPPPVVPVRADRSDRVSHELRIIGGRYRGSRLQYGAHANDKGLVTRPMKHRVREAIFNLVGSEMPGKLAIDLFAGTGAIGLEAISRGAERCLFIEKHVPSAGVVTQNIAALRLDEQCDMRVTSAMLWGKRDLATVPTDRPWAAFISPPYDFFVERAAEMTSLIAAVLAASPAESVMVVEADERFDFAQLPGGVKRDRRSDGWDVRNYAPAFVGVMRKQRGN